MVSWLLKPQINPVCWLATQEGSPVKTALGCTGMYTEGSRIYSHSLMRDWLLQHLEISFLFCLFGQQAMSLGFEIPERAGIMETFYPLEMMSVAKPGTAMPKKALLSLSSG